MSANDDIHRDYIDRMKRAFVDLADEFDAINPTNWQDLKTAFGEFVKEEEEAYRQAVAEGTADPEEGQL